MYRSMNEGSTWNGVQRRLTSSAHEVARSERERQHHHKHHEMATASSVRYPEAQYMLVHGSRGVPLTLTMEEPTTLKKPASEEIRLRRSSPFQQHELTITVLTPSIIQQLSLSFRAEHTNTRQGTNLAQRVDDALEIENTCEPGDRKRSLDTLHRLGMSFGDVR